METEDQFGNMKVKIWFLQLAMWLEDRHKQMQK